MSDIFEIGVLAGTTATPTHPIGAFGRHVCELLARDLTSGCDIHLRDVVMRAAYYDGDVAYVPSGRYVWSMLMQLLTGEHRIQCKPSPVPLFVYDYVGRVVMCLEWEEHGVGLAIPGRLNGVDDIITNVDDECRAVMGDPYM